jgi:neutral ceramidase
MRFLVLFGVLAACNGGEAPVFDDPTPVVPGAPNVGAAEGELKLPVGSPLAGYTARCSCMSGQSRQDKRDSAYNYSFVESTGVHTTPSIKVIWIDNGDDHLVLTKTDQIYSYEGIVIELTKQLEEATGERLDGRVVHSTNHSHSSYGSFTKQKTFYLGSDKYNEEQFQNEVSQIRDVALAAYAKRQPAKVGMSWGKDWDPHNLVYRDRRGDNNELAVWDDVEPGMGKDPHVAVMRYDSLDGDPIAVGITFGMHGILGSETSPLISADSSLSVEHVFREQFDSDDVVVMFTQGSGGDASPAGTDDDFARSETIGLHAIDALYDLWENTPLSSEPIRMESASRHYTVHPSDMHVTRGGTTDLYYLPYEEDRLADDVIYDENGDLIGAIDEFNTEFGAAFCGNGDFDFPVGKIESTEAWPYSNCMQVELLSRLVLAFFDLTEEDIELPFPELVKSLTTVTRMGPLPTVLPDGTTVEQDLLMGFFPGEATAMFSEQWRRRAKAELGYEQALMVGYSQDHEGYLLIPEDWLMGGYEPDITFWGPLSAEYIMELTLATADEILSTDVHEDVDPWAVYTPAVYEDFDLPTNQPDTTPDAGTRLMSHPDLGDGEEHREQLFTPMEMAMDLQIPDEVPRVQGQVQLLWKGGDPGVDFPTVTLQVDNGGSWVDATTHSGRPINESLPDILVGYTPDPLFPFTADQDHYWFATWQAVGHIHDRTGLPEGTYRLRVDGKRYLGGNTTWPWDTEAYEVLSDEFDVVPGVINVEYDAKSVFLSWATNPSAFRLIELGGQYDGLSPVLGQVTVVAGGDPQQLTAEKNGDGRSTFVFDAEGAASITVTDQYGNSGTLEL